MNHSNNDNEKQQMKEQFAVTDININMKNNVIQHTHTHTHHILVHGKNVNNFGTDMNTSKNVNCFN